MKNQICTILGGGGFIGRYLVRNLTKKNYRCIITTRKPFQKGYLKTQSTPGAIELLDWNPNNFSELKEAIKNSDVVVNLIGILFETRKQKFYNIHSKIPEVIAKICSESDVNKFIHVSAIGANDKSKSLYQKSKFLGEKKALENLISKLKKVTQDTPAEEIQTLIYSTGKENGYTENLRDWFRLIYQVVFGEENGPRMGFFISFFGVKETIDLMEKKLKI